jgi:SAM-dependent methyltransferase
MKAEQDAYGMEIWAFYKGKKDIVEIIERSEGYIDVSGGPETYFADYKDWPELDRKAMKFVKGRVLDVGCGAGRCSLWLQRKGFKVTGIDNSPLAIKVCRLRGLKDARVLPIEKVNFRPGSYDTIIMMGNNFGLFSNFKKAKTLLKKFYRMTGKDAKIVAESNDPYKTDNPAHKAYQSWNRRHGRMSGQLKIRIRFMDYRGNWFDYLLVSQKEMKKILQGTGWKAKKFIGKKGRSNYIAIIEKM